MMPQTWPPFPDNMPHRDASSLSVAVRCAFGI
jgi:hypothetical protein